MAQGTAPDQAPLQWDLLAAAATTSTAAADTRDPQGTMLTTADRVVAQATVTTTLTQGKVLFTATVGLMQVGSSLSQAACRLRSGNADVSQEYFADFHHSSDDHPIPLTGVASFSNPSGNPKSITATAVCYSTAGNVQLFGTDLTGIAAG